MPDDDAAPDLRVSQPAADGAVPSRVDSDAVPIVGIGASAGGVEALIQFFGAIPA